MCAFTGGWGWGARTSEQRTAACGWGVIGNKGGLLTGDGLVRSECSVIIVGYNTERRCQTDTLILAVGKGRCRSRGGIRLHINNAIVS